MRKGILISACGLLVAAGSALAEPPSPVTRAYLDKSVNPAAGVMASLAEEPGVPAEGVGAPAPGHPDHITTPDACNGNGCATCREPCGPPGRFWVSAEYLLWWIKDERLPPLVTAGPAGTTGVLGSPGTTVIFGGSDLNHEEFSGGRFAAGFWLDDCQTVGVEADFFFLAPRSSNFFVGGGTGGPIIARPIINALTGEETSEFVSSPLVSGNIQVHSRSELFGAEVNGICNLCCCCTHRLDLLGGFRYLQLEEKLDITEDLTLAPTVPTFGGSHISVRDHFETQNRFYGGQLGVRGEWWRGRAFVNVRGEVTLGETHESIDIRGVTTLTPPGGTTTTVPGGILALPSNSGHFTRDEFSVVPEVGINVGYQVTNHLRAYVGYTFLYWSDVVRPGDQIDRTINLTQVPSTGGSGVLVGPARPAVLFKTTDFWAQGINLGLEFRF